MVRRRVIVALSALGILLIGIVGVMAVIGLTQTAWGRGRIRGLVAAELRRSIHGHVYIGALHGNLFTTLTVDSLELRAPDGQLLVATGLVQAVYDPRDLWDRRLLFQRLEVDHPYVQLIHYHDDSWNYSKIFPRPAHRLSPGEARGFGDFIVARAVTIRNGVFVYTNRWNPDDSLRGARRDSAIREGLTRPHYGLNRTPMGLMRTLAWTGIQITAPYARIADPDSVGPAFQLARLDMDEFFPPFRFSHVEGRVRVVHDSLWATLRHVELPGTAGRGEGKVWWGSNRPLSLALHFDADSLSLADIAWVYPTLPQTGGGRAVVDIRSDRTNPEIVDYVVKNMDLHTTESRLRGTMTFGAGRPQLVIKDVAVEFAPVDFALIRVLAGGKPFPIDWAGQWTGRVRGAGGLLSRFRTDTVDLTLHDGHVVGATTRLSGSGELDISQPALTAFHHFRLTLDRFDLRTPQYVLPSFPRLQGVVRGTATLDSVWRDVRFTDADLTHIDGPGSPSRITGSGRFTLGDSESTYDMQLRAQPLSFETVARSYPGLPLHGEFSGPVSLQGTLANLDLKAQLTGAPGVLGVDGHFTLVRPGLAGSGVLTLLHTDLKALLGNDSLPQTDLSVRLDADVRGDSLAALDGPMTATLAPSDVGQLELDTARFVGRFGGERLRVDTLRIESPGGSVTGSGAIALAARRSDSLTLAIALDSLGGWRRFLSADTGTAQPLPGTVRMSTTLRGWLDSLAASGTLQAAGLRVGGLAARGASGTFDLARVAGRERGGGVASLGFDGVSIGGIAVDHVGITTHFMNDGMTQVAVAATTPFGAQLAAGADVRQSRDTTLVTLQSLTVSTRRDTLRLVAPAHVERDASGLRLDRLALRGANASVTATANLPQRGEVAAHVQIDSLPLAVVGELLESSAAYGGWASVDWSANGDRARPVMRADGRLVGGQFGDVRLEEVLAHGEYHDRRLQLHGDLVQRGDTTLHALVSLPANLAFEAGVRRLLPDDSLRGNVRADSVQFGALATIYPTLQNPRGSFTANVDLGGTLGHPALNGEIRLVNGEAGFPRVGVRFVGMNADLHLAGDSLVVRDVSLATVEGQRRGRALLRGWVTFADVKDPRFNLVFQASDLHALSHPRVADVTISTVRPLQLAGRLSRSDLTGAVSVDRGAIYLPDITQKNVVSLDDPEFFNLVDTSLFQNRLLLPEAPTRLLQDLTLSDVEVTLGNEVWLKSSEANINLSTSQGPLRLTTASTGRGSTKGLALAGSLIAERGDYRLNLGIVQRTFTVGQGGTVRFVEEPDINPYLNISAFYTVRQPRTNAGNSLPDLRIRVVLGGRLERPTIALSSADSSLQLSQSDLLSYLVTGQQSFAVGGAGENAQAAASFFLPTLATALGSRLSGGLFEQISIQTPTTYGLNNTGSTFRNVIGLTRIGAGKQFGRSTFVSADLGVCGLGVSGPAAQTPPTTSQIGVRVEQQLTQRFTLAASSEPGTSALYCAQGALSRSFVDTPRQWGLDLFRSWQF